jgi:hypothetical protein
MIIIVKKSLKVIAVSVTICAITFIAQYSFLSAAKAFGLAHAQVLNVPAAGQ